MSRSQRSSEKRSCPNSRLKLRYSEAQLNQVLQLKKGSGSCRPDSAWPRRLGGFHVQRNYWRVNSTLTQNDFSTQSMKSWRTKFTRLFDSSFITGRLAQLAIVWNTCSDSTKNRILCMGIGARASADDFRFTDLLRIVCILYGSSSHSEIALQSIYSGVPQS